MAAPAYTTFSLNSTESEILMREVNGNGGFQSFLRRLQRNYNSTSGKVSLTDQDIGKVFRHIGYNQGGFEGRLSNIFSRNFMLSMTS